MIYKNYISQSLSCLPRDSHIVTDESIWKRVFRSELASEACTLQLRMQSQRRVTWWDLMMTRPICLARIKIQTQKPNLQFHLVLLKPRKSTWYYILSTPLHGVRCSQTSPSSLQRLCYISTVNYPTPGATNTSSSTWGTPILISLYFRYLRFLP